MGHDYAVKTNSVEDLSLEDMLSVAPNPTTGIVNINVNLPENEVINIAIYNTMGQEVVITEGRFKGNLVKICSLPAAKRINILIHVLGSKRKVNIALKDLSL